MLKLQQVSVKSPIILKPLLLDISACVQPGDRIALMGVAGSGKSLLLRLINRLISPCSGCLYFRESNYQNIDPVWLRQKITLVLPEPRLLGMRVSEAIAYPLRLRKMSEDELTTRVNLWVERLAIPPDILALTEVQLSSRQQQWISLTRGLVIQPDILLLDEPTANLNPQQQQCLAKILTDFYQGENMAIVATHNPDFARQFATRVWYLHQGELVDDLPVEQVNWAEFTEVLQSQKTAVSQEWDNL
ncbi:ABC transporter ATP-binding protein [Limnospira fusiformis]|uniref:ABC transporter ATP-binding protein n=1 Tax=Limnospira fusiformis TaxID=54297 RepID=UPI002AA0FC4A|nr:ATP-binding cassette domain-containing protein [Limnospira fusiformis LS22]MDY7055167.1 ATP-binding cassette domain-containing protein [Limnospira fusiformis LS22]